MSTFFKPLPSDCIDYYDLGRERFAALSYLAAGAVGRNIYLKPDLGISIGRLNPETALLLPLTPPSGGQLFLTRIPFVPYAAAGKDAIEHTVGRLNAAPGKSGVTPVQLAALCSVHRSLINYDRQVFGGDQVRIGTDTDNRILSPRHIKAPMWHFDSELDQAKAPQGFMLPARLHPVVRGYAIRIVPPGHVENVQPEYVKDSLLALSDGRPHPVVWEAWRSAQKAIAYRTALGIKTRYIGEHIEKNAAFAAGWKEFLQEQADITSRMRNAGLVQQARPYEILLATNYSYHKTCWPAQTTPSLFMGLQVRPS